MELPIYGDSSGRPVDDRHLQPHPSCGVINVWWVSKAWRQVYLNMSLWRVSFLPSQCMWETETPHITVTWSLSMGDSTHPRDHKGKGPTSTQKRETKQQSWWTLDTFLTQAQHQPSILFSWPPVSSLFQTATVLLVNFNFLIFFSGKLLFSFIKK